MTAEEEIHLVTVSNVVGRGLSLQGITTDGSRPPRSDRGIPFPGLAALAAIAGAGDSRLEIFSPSRQRSVAKREAMGQARTDLEQDHIHKRPLPGQTGGSMKTYRRAHDYAVQTADNDWRAGSTDIIPLRSANAEKTKRDTSILKPRPVLQTAVLTRDLIAERAMAIWLKRGCPRDRDEENWREAEAQLKTEMGIEQ